MKIELLDLLRCPVSGNKLLLTDPVYVGDKIHSGWLIAETDTNLRYKIQNFIPRFVPESNYADNFGMQWNMFSETQLDSYSGQKISTNRFWNATKLKPEDIKGKWILDVGCGAGRFAEVALSAGANLVALDYSSAVDACYANLSHHPNLHLVQGDIYALPFVKDFFPIVYSLGVLQHTPDVAKSFAALPPHLQKGGLLVVDLYWIRWQTLLHTKYLLRPFTKRMNQKKLFGFLQKWIPTLLKTSQILGSVPLIGRFLKRAIPVADYTGIYPLNAEQLKEWALLDTFDMLAPEYDNPQTINTIQKWFEKAEFINIEIFHEGHLVGRGNKSI